MSRNLAIVQDSRMGKDGSHRRLTVASVEEGNAERRKGDAEDRRKKSGESNAGKQQSFWGETPGGPGDAQERQAERVTQQVVWFNGGDAEVPAGPIDLLYHLNINEYRGRRSLQLMYVDIHPAGEEIEGAPAVEVQLPPLIPGALRIHDWRHQPAAPSDLPDRAAAQWYAEGARLPVAEKAGADEVAFAPRTAIVHDPERALVVWSVPPSPGLLRWLVETAGAQEVYLCAQETTDDNLAAVLKQVAGLCKYALGRDRLLNVEAMAARLGTSEAAIHKALRWLEQRGLIALVEWSPDDAPADAVRIAPGAGERHDDESELLQARLLEELAEVRARRRFYRRATIAELGLTAGAIQQVSS
jgi:single-stranded-DNA-specific exonuclease